MTDPEEAGDSWTYLSFLPLTDWAAARVDERSWRSTVERLQSAQVALDESARDDEIARSLRAAALNTGALEGLHNAERGLTVTVVQEAAWQAAIDRTEGREARSFVEAALAAFDLAFDVATRHQPLTEAIIRRMHEVVTGPQITYEAQTPAGRQEVLLHHGTYKTLPNHVVEPDGTKHAYAPPDLVRDEMARLVEELRDPRAEETHPVVVAAFAHHAFVAVHPFEDGNGRVARLLGSIYTLRAASVPLMIWADQSLEYRAALKRADKGDPQAFVDFVFDRTIDAMNLMDDRLRLRALPSGFKSPDAEQRRQLDAAERLAALLLRTIDEAVATPPGGVTTNLEPAHPSMTDIHRFQPFPGCRVVLMVGQRQQIVHFGVTVPRDETDSIDAIVEGHDHGRRFRTSDVVPTLKDSAVEQMQAFVRRVLGETAAAVLGSSIRPI